MRFQSLLLHSLAAVLTALLIKSKRRWKDIGWMWRRGIRVFISPLLKWLRKESKRSWFMSPLLHLFFPLPFIRWGLCEWAWLAEQLQMRDAIHTARFQSYKSSEFRTLIIFNYVNHMPQIFPIKSWGRSFSFSLRKFSVRLPREAGWGNFNWTPQKI